MKDSKSPFKHLGNKTDWKSEELDVFESCGIHEVTFETNELSSHCPVTNQPDFYNCKIAYLPANYCIESKSLKLYLQTYRSKSEFCESLAVIIANDIMQATRAKKVCVVLTQQSRGGLVLQAKHEVTHESDRNS